ncbi:MAG TPA: aldo/keto reductase [Candidimonas sp.]|nr:aldo/keto reductase [Candidimonas sp.]
MADTRNNVSFHDGRSAPRIGLGLWQVDDDTATSVVATALDAGYRSIDTAAIYGNEAGVGRAIAQSAIKREDIFIATKLWNDSHGHDSTLAACHESLEKLGLDYVDMYLIHWPVPKVGRFIEAWESMIQLRDEGCAKSIGVCNFNINHLELLLDETGVLPVVNQIELHPRFQQRQLRDFHAQQDIVTESWSPLGQGQLWDEPVLAALAQKHNRSMAQIILRWHVQLGNMVIPKTVSPDRLRQNLQVFDFMLDDDDMTAIAALDRENGRIGPDPELFRLPKQPK